MNKRTANLLISFLPFQLVCFRGEQRHSLTLNIKSDPKSKYQQYQLIYQYEEIIYIYIYTHKNTHTLLTSQNHYLCITQTSTCVNEE